MSEDGRADERPHRDPLLLRPLFLWLITIAGLVITGGWVRWSGMVSGLVPVADLHTAATVFYLVLFAPLAGLAWLLGRICAAPAFRLGRKPAGLALLGLAVGSLGIGIALALAWANAGVLDGAGGRGLGPMLLLGLALTLIQTTAEEMLFRGWLQGTLTRLTGPLPGLTLAALCFAAMHMAGGPVSGQAFINLTLAGLVFGLLAWKSGGLAAPIAAHFAWNAIEDLGFGLVPNPGMGAFGAIHDIDITGPAIWGGGEAGLNASIGTSAVLFILVIALIVPRRAPDV